MLKKYSQKGFTIVELLIVIVVIGILAALVMNTFSGAQKKARDTQRSTDVNSISTQLEVYYNEKGGYPSANATDGLANNTWIGNNLKGLDLGAVKSPKAPAATLNSIVITTPSSTSDVYQYAATPGLCVSPTVQAGTANTGTFCTGFTLTWWNENTGALVNKSSLN